MVLNLGGCLTSWGYEHLGNSIICLGFTTVFQICEETLFTDAMGRGREGSVPPD